MSKNQFQQPFNLSRAVKKIFLSSFVVFTFIAYVIHQRFTNPDSALNPAATPSSIFAQSGNSSGVISSPAGPRPNSQSSVQTNTGLYRDGIYTGPQIDVYYGLVEVQVNVQHGKIEDVQFLKYPNDRRTSVRINDIAMPYLQQEAIQAQSAHINIISGATFTSEGFAMSLNEALKSAKN